MIALPTLYPHQEDLRDRTRASLAKHGRVILCAGCGVGKTRTAKWILGAALNREPTARQSGRSLFAVHRRGLVDNASKSFLQDPVLPHGVIMSGEKPKYGARIQVASIDTLLAWFIEGGRYETNVSFDLVVFDETHSHLSRLRKFLEHHDAYRAEMGLHPAYVIGLTATPQAEGLADVYREIVRGPTTEWLIANGFLAPFRYFRATQGKLGLLVRKGGEFTQESEAKAMEGLAGDLVRDWKRFAEGRPTVGFFPRRSHAQEAQQTLADAGLRVEYVDGETPDEVRDRIYRDLNEGRIDYLCNVQVVERGADIPRIGCVQLCVAIGSVVRYLQMVGRGSRFDAAKYPDKKDCLVLDHGGNVARHGFFEDEFPWSLDRTTKDAGETGTRPTIACPQCDAIYRGGKCRRCGYEPTTKERKSEGLEFDGTELREVRRDAKKPKAEKTPEELMIGVLYAAGRSGRTWKQAVGMFYRACEKTGRRHRVPKTVEVGGQRYEMLPHGSDDGGRRVGELFPFTRTRGVHGGDYAMGTVRTETGGAS